MATTQGKIWFAQFTDSLGNPVAGVKVYHYVSGTNTDKDVYRDAGKTTSDTQPVVGDVNGFVSFYGDGNYRLKITTSADILLYDLQDVDITGQVTGINTRIPFFDSAGAITDDARLTYDAANNRIALGTSANITEKLTIPYGYLGIVRDGASVGESARGVIGLNQNNQVAIDRDGQGIVLPNEVAGGLLYLDANGRIRVLSLTNGQLPIGSTGLIPVAALPIEGTGIDITPGAGSLTIIGSGPIYNRAATSLTIENTTTRTTLYSFTAIAGDLSTNKVLRIVIVGTYLNNSGATRTLTVKVLFGATTLYEDVTAAIAASATARPFIFTFDLCNQNDAAVQRLFGELVMGNVAAATTGTGDLATDSLLNTSVRGAATENTASSSLLFDVQVTHSVANANLNIIRDYGYASLI